MKGCQSGVVSEISETGRGFNFCILQLKNVFFPGRGRPVRASQLASVAYRHGNICPQSYNEFQACRLPFE